MNGPHLDDELSALLDGELEGAEHDEAVAHLRECAFCTSELAAVERTRSLVRSLPMVDPPNALRPRQEQRAGRSTGLAAAAAAAVVFVVLQALPPDRSVSVAIGGLVEAHASRAVSDPPLVETRLKVSNKSEQAEFDVIPVAGRVPLSAKYTVVTAPGRVVAERDTIEFIVADKRTGQMVEKAVMDRETGMVVWRELYDDNGEVVRTVEVEWLKEKGAPPPVAPQRSAGTLIATPERLDGDYQRVGVYRRGDVVHQLFSDGLHTLSVFAEAGDLDAGALPGNGRVVTLDDKKASHYDWPGGDVLVWESGGVVYTAVGDGSVEDVMAAAASMPDSGKLSVGERLRRGCRAMADALTG